MITADEHRAWVMKQAALWDAEANGVLDAETLAEPRKAYESVTFQRRYEKGFYDMKAKLDCQQVTA